MNIWHFNSHPAFLNFLSVVDGLDRGSVATWTRTGAWWTTGWATTWRGSVRWTMVDGLDRGSVDSMAKNRGAVDN